MDAALGWIGELFQWFGQWVPRPLLVRATHRGVRFRLDKVFAVGPGLHLYWPITTQVEVYPVVRQLLRPPTQTLTTEDGEIVVAGGVVIYTITDIVKFLAENYNADDSVSDAAQVGIRKTIVDRTFAQIQKDRADIDNRLTLQAQRALESFGVSVEAVRLTDFAKANVLNIVSAKAGALHDSEVLE